MSETADKLARLRAELKARGATGFVVPRTDEHNSEYVPAYAERLAWLTDFTGSAGTAVVLGDQAALFVDGRYVLQAAEQVDMDHITPVFIEEKKLAAWVKEAAQEGDVLGYDPKLHSIGWVKEVTEALAVKGAEAKPLSPNPIDAVWDDQPPLPTAAAVPHGAEFAGMAAADKRAKIAETLADKGADAAAITMLDSVAWLLNIRGTDVVHTPVAQAYAIAHADGAADLFIDGAKVTDELREHLGNQVRLRGYEEFDAALADLGQAGKAVLADPATASAAVFATVEDAGAKLVKAADPCALPKAIKNEVEKEGTRRAHRRDGAALSEFLHWLAVEGPKGGLDEMDAADKLQAFRARRERFEDLSFDTISGAGSNGAVIHYRVTEETNKPIEPDSVYLVDSGGQYLDGTTDVTRTVAIGEVGREEKERFTLVLKGHIALATARFPKGTGGGQLDTLARRPLWQAGLDYDHGTGHGVGSYLAVHEGPQRIAKMNNGVGLEPGMILSNEPGYYKPGAYGMRIENLVLVTEPEAVAGGERPMLGFETLTLAPIDRNMILPELLTEAERGWLNAYHARVRTEITPHVDAETAAWLAEATAEI
ncbi:MAG: aminopeptidase P family protein [Sphingomonadales bacterium]|nr:aminopeptidase P family protein [Sphingomonadales bacterium]